MSDPFGTDDIDFDIDAMLTGAFNNTVSILKDNRQPLASQPAPALHNPLLEAPKPAKVGAADGEAKRMMVFSREGESDLALL